MNALKSGELIFEEHERMSHGLFAHARAIPCKMHDLRPASPEGYRHRTKRYRQASQASHHLVLQLPVTATATVVERALREPCAIWMATGSLTAP